MTAEEFEEKNCGKYDSYSSMMRDFARFHVYQAVKAQIRLENDRISDDSEIDNLTKEALNHIYPLENIK